MRPESQLEGRLLAAFGCCLSYQAMGALAAGQVETLIDDDAPPPVPVHLVYQANRRASVNVRAFIEAARLRFAGLDLIAATP